jgi:hypothetical protein
LSSPHLLFKLRSIFSSISTSLTFYVLILIIAFSTLLPLPLHLVRVLVWVLVLVLLSLLLTFIGCASSPLHAKAAAFTNYTFLQA